MLNQIINEHINVVNRFADQVENIEKVASLLLDSFRADKKILLAGNGGSAADAQHFAAELIGRFEHERNPLPALALTTDPSAVTAISNDYGFDRLFERQLQGLARSGDTFIGISTSGNSSNINNALIAAKRMKIQSVLLTGATGGSGAALADHCILVPSTQTARIQEIHILIIHLICSYIDTAYWNE